MAIILPWIVALCFVLATLSEFRALRLYLHRDKEKPRDLAGGFVANPGLEGLYLMFGVILDFVGLVGYATFAGIL